MTKPTRGYTKKTPKTKAGKVVTKANALGKRKPTKADRLGGASTKYGRAAIAAAATKKKVDGVKKARARIKAASDSTTKYKRPQRKIR